MASFAGLDVSIEETAIFSGDFISGQATVRIRVEPGKKGRVSRSGCGRDLRIGEIGHD